MMTKKEWLIWLITVLLIVVASTVPFVIGSFYGTIFEIMRFYFSNIHLTF